jgi:hypothetical protein
MKYKTALDITCITVLHAKTKDKVGSSLVATMMHHGQAFFLLRILGSSLALFIFLLLPFERISGGGWILICSGILQLIKPSYSSCGACTKLGAM